MNPKVNFRRKRSNTSNTAHAQQYVALHESFRKVERREWWLWAAAFIITILLMIGLLSFLLPTQPIHVGAYSNNMLPRFVRGLVGLVFLFDLYTIYQHLLIFRIRKRLLEREELFHLISENAADMIAVVDMEGHRLFNSVSYQRVLGYSPEELVTSSAYEQIHPEDRRHVQKATENARFSGTGARLEYRIRHKNGSWVPLESTSSVIRNSEGEPVKLVIVNRDITERKRAEEALRRSEADFRSVVEHAPYGIYRASNEGHFLQANPALRKMLSYESADVLSDKNITSEIFRYDGEYRRMIDILGRAGEFKDMEMEWKRLDGAPITVRCSGQRIKNVDGIPAYFEVFAEDVTEKRALERQLRMAQKMEAVGRLSGGIAHDFNTLLGVITGYAGLLKKGLEVNNPLREHAQEIEKAGERAASLTKQLLAFSRRQVLTPTVLNLNTLTSDMEKMLPRLIGEHIELSIELAADLGAVKADQSQIEQVIMNLAVNARDAMPSGGKLKLQTANVELDHLYARTHPGSRPGSYVLLAMTDTGMGMDPETLAHVFEPFFTTKEPGKGTGLGLATVYGIVKQSNGYIWVESEPEKGASFQIYLPRHFSRIATEERQAEPQEKLRGSESILLVEDAEPLRKLAQRFLEAGGFRVVTASNGEQALEVAAHYPGTFDLLLTDVVMPRMNGRTLAERLVPRQPGMKVLYMSGYTDSFIAGQGVLEPGINILHKPFTEESLVRKVRDVLDGDAKPLRSKNDTGQLAASGVVPAR